jgi:hypothetical protein
MFFVVCFLRFLPFSVYCRVGLLMFLISSRTAFFAVCVAHNYLPPPPFAFFVYLPLPLLRFLFLMLVQHFHFLLLSSPPFLQLRLLPPSLPSLVSCVKWFSFASFSFFSISFSSRCSSSLSSVVRKVTAPATRQKRQGRKEDDGARKRRS